MSWGLRPSRVLIIQDAFQKCNNLLPAFLEIGVFTKNIKIISSNVDSTTYTYSYKYSFKFLLNVQIVLDDIVKKKASQTSGIVLTDAQKEILNGKNVDLTGSAGTEITNLILNNTIGDIVDPSTDIGKTVDAVLKSLLKTNVNLKDALTDVWKNLVNGTRGRAYRHRHHGRHHR